MQRVLLLIFFITLFCQSTTLLGNCRIENTTSPNGTVDLMSSLVGQQFLACEDGTITTIDVNTTGIGDIDLYLLSGNGSAINYGFPIQTFTPTSAGLISLTLNQPFQVIKDSLYSFALGNVSGVIYDDMPLSNVRDATLPDGQFSFSFTNSGVFTVVPESDILFGISSTSPPPITIPNIPTLSQWSLLIFGLLILNLSVLFINTKVAVKVNGSQQNKQGKCPT